MSAVFSIIEGIVQVLIEIVEGLAQVLGYIVEALAAIPQVVGGIGQAVPYQLIVYVFWFSVEAVLVALFPSFALLITIGFFLFTIYGLLQGLQDILGAPTAALSVIAALVLAFNVYLLVTVG